VETNIRLGPGATIQVRVRDAAGKPVAGAGIRMIDESGREVSFAQPPQRTSETGEFVASGARLGAWRAVIERDGKKIGEGIVDARRQGAHSLEITAQP
jgi:hypothetical protein